MLTSGDATAHIRRLRHALARRAQLLADAINQQQPTGTPPLALMAAAGYFLWVDLRGVEAAELRARCVASHGVTFLPGPRCALPPAVGSSTRNEPAGTALASLVSRGRVCFAFLEEDALVEAGRRLGRAIAQAAVDNAVNAH